jgi:hypothetical protein
MEKIDKGIKLISVSGKPGTWYRADKYHIENGKIVKNTPSKMTTQQSDITTDGSTNTRQSDITTADSTNAKNTNSTAKNVVSNVGNVIGQAFTNAATAQGINDPQTGHYNRQAALSEAQAAKTRADEQLARQEAYRNTGDRALTESAKIAEASSAANIRNNQKAMSAEMGGAAATMAAAKNAAVDPMQNAMTLKQAGYNRQDRATQLAQTATSNQTAAEGQRAQATQSLELAKQQVQRNAQADRVAKANEEQRAAELEETKARAALQNAQAGKATAEQQQTETDTEAQKQEQKNQAISSIDDLISKGAKVSEIYSAYIKTPKTDQSDVLHQIVGRYGQNSANAQEFYNIWKTWNTKEGWDADPNLVGKWEKADQYMRNTLLSDKRMKIIHSPIGRTLMHFYNGRT